MDHLILHSALTTHAIPATNTDKCFGENLTHNRDKTSFNLCILHHIKGTEGAGDNTSRFKIFVFFGIYSFIDLKVGKLTLSVPTFESFLGFRDYPWE